MALGTPIHQRPPADLPAQPRGPGRRGALRQGQAGFTLVEVMVALFIMAVLAGMAWQGIDGLVRVRDGASGNTEASLRLSNVLTQWEQDLNQIQQSSAAPGLRYDGSALRLTRRTPDGIQIVVWTLQGSDWYRWASPSVTRIQDLQEWWMRSQQWTAINGDALKMLDGVASIQVYYYWNAWSNAQSTGEKTVVVVPNPPDAPPSIPGDGGSGGVNANNTAVNEDQLPGGVRLVLTLPAGVLTRDLAIHPSS